MALTALTSLSAPRPDFPNVPFADGVPPVKRDFSNSATGAEDKLTSDSNDITVYGLQGWGVYKGGSKALDPDTIVSVGYSAEHRIADFPIEQGSFETYDKVALPFESAVVMSKGGKAEDRRAFLSALEDIRGDLELYSVVTPEKTYLNVNISRVSVDRSREQGAGMITAEIHLTEIRANATATFSKAKDPASADTKSDGSVQAKPADPAVEKAVEAKTADSPAAVTGGGSSFFDGATQALQTIPMVAGIPSQSLVTNLANQAVGVVLSQKRTGLFADVSLNGATALSGILCRDGVPLLQGAVPDFPGDLAFFDMMGGDDPDFTGLDSRFKLVWAN